MKAIKITGIDKSILNKLEARRGKYYLQSGTYSVARELSTCEVVYVAKNYSAMKKATEDHKSDVGNCIAKSMNTISVRGAIIIEKEVLKNIRVLNKQKEGGLNEQTRELETSNS